MFQKYGQAKETLLPIIENTNLWSFKVLFALFLDTNSSSPYNLEKSHDMRRNIMLLYMQKVGMGERIS
jgi:hypothetical protein